MAEQQTTAAENPGKLAMVSEFLADTRTEMDKVSWPPRPDLIQSTRAVIIGSIILGVAIGLVDKLLQLLLVDGVAALAR